MNTPTGWPWTVKYHTQSPGGELRDTLDRPIGLFPDARNAEYLLERIKELEDELLESEKITSIPPLLH